MYFLNRVYSFNDIANPSFVEGLELSELHYCLSVVDSNLNYHQKVMDGHNGANPDNPLSKSDFPDWDFDLKIQAVLLAEIGKRMQRFAPPKPKKSKAAPPPEKILPELEKVLRSPGSLPKLWARLVGKQRQSERDKDLFDSSGYVGGDERSASPLMGFTIGLRQSGQIIGAYSDKDVYLILCRRFNVKPTSQRSKAAKRATAIDVRGWVKGFNGF